MVIQIQNKQAVDFCFREMNRADLAYYNVKKGNKLHDWEFEWRRPYQ